MVDGANGIVGVVIVGSDHNGDPGGPLVDHRHGDVVLGQWGENVVDDADPVAHPLADNHGDGVVIDPFEPVRVDGFLDFVGDGIDQLVVNQVAVEDDGDVIDPGWHVFIGDVVFSKDLQDAKGKPGLLVQQVLVEVEGREVLAADNPGDNVARLEALVGNDQGAGFLRVLGVLDVDRDVAFDRGDQGLVMEDREAGVGEFPHLPVGHPADRLRVVDDVRVSRIDRVDVGEVLVQVGVQAPGQDRPGDVGAAPGEGRNVAGQGDAVETREDQELALLGRELVEETVCLGDHTGVVRRPGDPNPGHRWGDEAGLVAQVLEDQGHQLGVGAFPVSLEGGQEVIIVRVLAIGQVAQTVDNRLQLVIGQVEVVGNCLVTDHDLVEHVVIRLLVDHPLGIFDQQIGHLNIVGIPLAGRGGDDHPTLGIGRNNLDCLGKSLAIS